MIHFSQVLDIRYRMCLIGTVKPSGRLHLAQVLDGLVAQSMARSVPWTL